MIGSLPKGLLVLVVLVGIAGAAEQPVSVQMHVHGSLSEGKGTMWGQTARAEANGLDVLWWTDHDNRISYWNMDGASRFGWEQGLTGEAPDSGAELEWKPDTYELEDQSQEVMQGDAFEGNRWLRLQGRAPAGSDWKILALRYETGKGLHHRSLLSDVWTRIAVRPPPDLYANKKVLLALRLELSTNLDGDPMTLTWLAGAPTPPSTQWHAWRALPQLTPGEWNLVELPITDQAIESFPFGDDNAFRRFFIAVAARDGATVEAGFDGFEIQVRGLRGQPLLDRQREVVTTRYSQNTGQLVGMELTPGGHHINAFGSSVPIIDYDTYDFGHHPEAAIQHVHAHGGLASYNHIFGAGGGAGLSPAEQQELIDKKAQALLEHDAYGADILEVGYQHRRLPIEGHLAVWDALSMKPIFLTGNGVSDDHHATRYEEMVNNMVTWLWVEAPSETRFLGALRAGRAFFGDPLLVDPGVSMDLATPEGWKMGQVVLTDRDRHTVSARITGLRDGYRVKAIVNGRVARSWNVQGSVFEGTGKMPTAKPVNFLRLEVWTGDDRPVLFSNPIWFLRQEPAGGIPPARAAQATNAATRVLPGEPEDWLSGRPTPISP